MKKWIKIPIYYTIINNKEIIDEELMREIFELKLKDLTQIKSNENK